MKKILSLLLIFILCFSFSNVGASDTAIEPVNFTIMDTFYTTVVKSKVNNRNFFDLTNNITTMELTNSQLQSILSYKASDPTSHLAIYETLNIKVTPVAGTNYESLNGKSIYFLASSAEHWEDSDNITLDMGDIAVTHNLDSNYYPWGFRVVYRLNSDDDYIETPPTDPALDNKTIEQQLAILLGIDLSSNPNGVIDEYKNLYAFDTLSNTYTSTIRYDFFDKDPNKVPVEFAGSDNSYNPSSLKLLGTEYVVIRYNNSPASSPTINEFGDNVDSEASTWIFIIGGLAIIGGSIYYYLKKMKKII